MPEGADRETRRYYDALSRTYDQRRQTAYHRMIDDLEVEVLVPYARGARVLELGCGTGMILRRIAPLAREAVGIDSSEGMAEWARRRDLDVRIADLRELPFEDGRFDLTYALKVLAHVPDVDRAIGEAVRVTRPGGFVVLELYNPWSLRYLVKKAGGPQPVGGHQTEADVYTRWDSPFAVRRLVPLKTRLVETRGIRVLTPFAAFHSPLRLARALQRAERWASRSPIRCFGGFIVAVLQKNE